MLGSARSSNVYDQINKMQAEISTLTSQLNRFAQREKKHAAGLASSVADNISNRYQDYSDQIGDIASTAGEHIDSVQKLLMKEVKTHPLRTLAVAGLIGIVFGAMSRGR